jgi:hypothetical protein
MLVRCILACPVSTVPSAPASSRPDSASASDSRFATSFLFGRRRFWDLVDDFSILETKDECLILSLSFFDEGNALSSASDSGWGSAAAGRTARADFARAVVRFLIGAYARQHLRLSCDIFGRDAYHSCAMGCHEKREVQYHLVDSRNSELSVIDKPRHLTDHRPTSSYNTP